ncbi:MAG: SDR family oxidoreductase [Bacteroidaceae bacterium]|nr:SDR family oxidoreductase [Bacteroidaceae bacterium]
MNNPLNLEGRRYLITGAASGMGKATSILLSCLGAELILLDINEEGLRQTASELSGKSYVLPIDLSDTNSIKGKVEEAVSVFGKINGFAHIAGIPYIAPLKIVNEERAKKIYRINQYAAVELAKIFQSKKVYAGEHGSVVLISSVYGVVGSAANVCYAMTKSAIIGITKALAMEFASRGIRVNCVAPGFVKSNMMTENAFRFDSDYMEKLESMHPLGLGAPEDIANSIAFLMSDMSKWTTGAVLNVDGGFTAQ